MIRLVKNEYIKIGFYKIIIMFIIFFIIVCLLYKYNSLDVALNKSFNLIPFVGVSSSILFSGIISTEYTNGNLRYYLTKPVKRWKIYFSKIISIFLYMLILVAFLILVNLIFIKKFDTSYMFKFILYSSSLIFIGTHIIFFSTLFKNTALVTEKTKINEYDKYLQSTASTNKVYKNNLFGEAYEVAGLQIGNDKKQNCVSIFVACGTLTDGNNKYGIVQLRCNVKKKSVKLVKRYYLKKKERW